MSLGHPRVRVFTDAELAVCRPLAAMAVENAFGSGRVPNEALVLGPAFVPPGGMFMAPGPDPTVTHENVRLITALVQRILPPIRERYEKGAEASDADRVTYIRCVFYFLYDSFDLKFQKLIDGGTCKAPFFRAFKKLYESYLGFLGKAPDVPSPKRLFEVFFQVRRAFYFLYVKVRGRSLPMAHLRARIWDAIFGGPLDQYGLFQWDRMHKISTLIVGPTGTGKELVAEAIARSGFVAFDEGTMSFAPYGGYYAGINLLAFAPGLLQSELYGHVKGAFTGAEKDKLGLLEAVPRDGGILLDEIFEIKPRMQAELLRVLQERTFRRVGDPDHERKLLARVLAATHRDPAERIACGRLREDFFERTCMIMIETPSLRERLDDRPEEIRDMAGFLARETFGPEIGGELTDEVEAFVAAKLPHHRWPGNMRELLRCVCHMRMTHVYTPLKRDAFAGLRSALRRLRVPMSEVELCYAEITYERTGSLPETARLLEIDPRTLKRMLAIEGR